MLPVCDFASAVLAKGWEKLPLSCPYSRETVSCFAGGAQADAGEAAAHHPRPPPQEVQVCGAVQQAHQGDQEDNHNMTILQSNRMRRRRFSPL
jgi:hypothetical protein